MLHVPISYEITTLRAGAIPVTELDSCRLPPIPWNRIEQIQSRMFLAWNNRFFFLDATTRGSSPALILQNSFLTHNYDRRRWAYSNHRWLCWAVTGVLLATLMVSQDAIDHLHSPRLSCHSVKCKRADLIKCRILCVILQISACNHVPNSRSLSPAAILKIKISIHHNWWVHAPSIWCDYFTWWKYHLFPAMDWTDPFPVASPLITNKLQGGGSWCRDPAISCDYGGGGWAHKTHLFINWNQ